MVCDIVFQKSKHRFIYLKSRYYISANLITCKIFERVIECNNDEWRYEARYEKNINPC